MWSLQLFHPVQSECVAVIREKDHVVFWCSNGIGWHCWAFDQFHKEWPVRKSYCLTEIRCLWVNVFFYAKFHFHCFQYAFLPICTLCLAFILNQCTLNSWLMFAKCVHFWKSMFWVDYCSVFHSKVESHHIYIYIWCDWEWFKPEWCLFYRERFAAIKFLNCLNKMFATSESEACNFHLLSLLRYYSPFKSQQHIS